MPKNSESAHITSKTLLPSAINAWEIYLADQGRSLNTLKAFLSDVRLLTKYIAPDRAIGDVTTEELNKFFECFYQAHGAFIKDHRSFFKRQFLHHGLSSFFQGKKPFK